MGKITLALCAFLVACGGGDSEPDPYEASAMRVCAAHGGVRSYSLAEWRGQIVLSRITCNDGLTRLV